MPDRSRGHRGRSARTHRRRIKPPACAGCSRRRSPSGCRSCSGPNGTWTTRGGSRIWREPAWAREPARCWWTLLARTWPARSACVPATTLAHALDGDCAPREACAPAGANLRILPAARALDDDGRSPERLRRFEAGVRALAATADCALLVLPAPRGAQPGRLLRGRRLRRHRGGGPGSRLRAPPARHDALAAERGGHRHFSASFPGYGPGMRR